MVIFNKALDWLILAVPTTVAIFLFYGTWLAVISFAVIAAVNFAKPLDVAFSSYWPRVIFACGLILLISPLFRILFPSEFCLGAPWSPIGGKAEAIGMMRDELGVGNYIVERLVQDCLQSLWSQTESTGGAGLTRDYVYPVIGAFGAVIGILKRDRSVSL